MNCRRCDKKAAIHMRQHKLALCREHYLEWIPEQTERFIKEVVDPMREQYREELAELEESGPRV